jgi:hypothetical protein
MAKNPQVGEKFSTVEYILLIITQDGLAKSGKTSRYLWARTGSVMTRKLKIVF